MASRYIKYPRDCTVHGESRRPSRHNSLCLRHARAPDRLAHRQRYRDRRGAWLWQEPHRPQPRMRLSARGPGVADPDPAEARPFPEQRRNRPAGEGAGPGCDFRLRGRRRASQGTRARCHRHPEPLRGLRRQPEGGRASDRRLGRARHPAGLARAGRARRYLAGHRPGRRRRRRARRRCRSGGPTGGTHGRGCRGHGRTRGASHGRLHRMDRPADGGRQLDARARGDGRRPGSLRHRRRARPLDDLGGPEGARSRSHRRPALRLRHRPDRGRDAGPDAAPGLGRASGCPRGPGLPDRRQPVLQPAGPRLAESLEILAEILHPGRIDFGHQGNAWRPL